MAAHRLPDQCLQLSPVRYPRADVSRGSCVPRPSALLASPRREPVLSLAASHPRTECFRMRSFASKRSGLPGPRPFPADEGGHLEDQHLWCSNHTKSPATGTNIVPSRSPRSLQGSRSSSRFRGSTNAGPRGRWPPAPSARHRLKEASPSERRRLAPGPPPSGCPVGTDPGNHIQARYPPPVVTPDNALYRCACDREEHHHAGAQHDNDR